MAGNTTFTYVDNSGEYSPFAIHTPDLDPLNIADYTSTLVGTELGNLKAALDALTLMNEVQIVVGATKILSPPTLPTNPNAQREQGLLIKYVDLTTNKKYRVTVPGVDRTLVAQTGTDVVDHTSNVFAVALVAAFESAVVSELGNPVAVYAMSLVGRNN